MAIRYWLSTFFTADFIPNRELRLSIADWLNTLIHDTLLKIHSDGKVSHFLTADKYANVYLTKEIVLQDCKYIPSKKLNLLPHQKPHRSAQKVLSLEKALPKPRKQSAVQDSDLDSRTSFLAM